jgi:hypothetical protein
LRRVGVHLAPGGRCSVTNSWRSVSSVMPQPPSSRGQPTRRAVTAVHGSRLYASARGLAQHGPLSD